MLTGASHEREDDSESMIGAFQFGIDGPPGAYAVLVSTDLASWSELAFVTNIVGRVVFTDGQAHLRRMKSVAARMKVRKQR